MLHTVRTNVAWRDWLGRNAREVVAMGLAVGLVLLIAPTARACNTPVYRYAMYNWPPAPYFVFYFHRGEPSPEDEKLNRMITELAETGPAVANVLLESVDVSQGQLDKLPEPVREAWQSHAGENAEKAEPAHLVFTSWGAKLHAGRLDEATVRAMVESPVRARIGGLLGDGCAAVMVFVPGSDAAENERAEKVAREVIDQAASGAIPIESAFGYPDPSLSPPPGEAAPDAPSEDASAGDQGPAASSALKVGLVKVARSDEAEKWLIRSLTAVESDLEELSGQPMIFFAYGRGRAMPPYVGKGINPENLTGEIQFLASACSCYVKEQNPGKDLLMHWDWDATADAMAATDPTLSGAQFAYQEFSPDETGGMAPSGQPEATAEVATAEVAMSVAGPPSQPDDAPPAQADASEPAGQAPHTNGAGSALESRPEKGGEAPAAHKPDELPGPVAAAPPGRGPAGSFATRQMSILGLGLAVVAAVVLVAGLVLVLKR